MRVKVNFDLRNKQHNNNVNFEGYKPIKDNYGKRIYEFNYPYDESAYDCYLEVCSVGTDTQGNYYVIEGQPCLTSSDGYYKLKPGKNIVDMGLEFNLREDQDFAYHYALTPKNADRSKPDVRPSYKIDAGDFIDSRAKGEHEIYNIVTVNGPKTYTGGAMKLLMPDFYNPMWTYDNDGKIIKNNHIGQLEGFTKTFSNKIGGNLAGIEKDVRDGKFDGYSRIISTPIFTDDDVSSHGYWNKNCMQMVHSLGNINNYASLQREMFKKGLNFVSDGAYVNEGLEGVHFIHVLKWGEKSPYFNWFKADLSNGPLGLGVFSKNTSFIKHKIVNSPYEYKQDPKTGKISIGKNSKYESNKPTYIQIFDDRLVSDKFKKDTQHLVKAYDILNTKNPLDINTHNDTIIPYAFEINPETYNENIKRLNEYNALMKNKTPKSLEKAFETAIDITFPAGSNPERKNKIKEALSNAVYDIYDLKTKESYTNKVHLIVQNAKKEYHLEIKDEEEKQLINNLLKLRDTISLDSYIGTRFVSKFNNFVLEEKIDGNFETWDANTDIAKLNYLYSNVDTGRVKLTVDLPDQNDAMNKLEQKSYEVQDYAIASGMFWTGKTKDILNLYVAQQLKGIDHKNPKKAYRKIIENINEGKFPEKLRQEINSAIIKNVLEDNYDLKGSSVNIEYKDYLLAGLMNTPLDSIEFGDNLVSVLASPYITKRATSEETLGSTRYEMYLQKNPHLTPEYEKTYKRMDNIYKKEMFKFASEVMDNLNEMLPEGSKIYEGYNATTLGRYILPQLTEVIAKYAMVKALAPKTSIKIDNETGEITYDYKSLKQTTTQTLGILASSPEDEANQVLNKIESGLKKLNANDKKVLIRALFETLKGTNENSFKLAEMITDRVNAGLDWRIDATKDIGDMNAMKEGSDHLDIVWPEVTRFWKKFADSVYSQNQNSYIVAEFTDESMLWNKGGGENSKKYTIYPDMIKKFLRETNMTSIANYSFYFSSLQNLFGYHFEQNDRTENANGFDAYLSHRIDTKTGEMLGVYSRKLDDYRNEWCPLPYESILHAYNFIGNHDRARVLHGLILNPRWFTQNLSDLNNSYFREKAYRILNDRFLGPIVEKEPGESDADYERRKALLLQSQKLSKKSGKALAMADSLSEAFKKTIAEKYPYDKDSELNKHIFSAIFKSISDLANGRYLGKNFSAEGFGVKPVDVALEIVLNQAKTVHGLKLSDAEIKELQDATFENVLTPALQKLQAMTEVLAILPGMPTLYAGDDTGTTGYESESKNIYLQNRSIIHNDWIDTNSKNYKKFIKDHYDKMNEAMKMRSRPELHALNDGAPFLLDIQHGTCDGKGIDVSAILRHGTDDSVVISLVNTSGVAQWYRDEYHPREVELQRIDINNNPNDKNPHTITKGLTPGTILYNANDKNDKYIVKEYNGKIFIKTIDDKPVKITGTTLTLYSIPPRNKVKTIYNKQFFIDTAKYRQQQREVREEGKRLSLVSQA